MVQEYYTIIHRGTVLYKDLTQDEYFDRLTDLAEDFYSTGSPNPSELETKITTG
jgi:hypothetical protein